MARRPAVAGAFYEGGEEALRRSIEGHFTDTLGPGSLPVAPEERAGRVLGLVCPHAAYLYSGSAAAWAYHALASDGIPDIAVLLGPNHRGLGQGIAIGSASEWTTPLGSVRVDAQTAEEILSASRYARLDDAAHFAEHSLEVQLPFIHYISGGRTSIVPIAISRLAPGDARLAAADLGAAIAGALRGKSAVVISSTDFSHYESRSVARRQDDLAIERIASMDPEGLLRVVREHNISMCGPTGAAAMLTACKALGASVVRKLTYYTSGDVTGDTDQVVGYAALSVER